MVLAKVLGSTVLKYPYGYGDLLDENPYTNFNGTPLPDAFWGTLANERGEQLVEVVSAAAPPFDPIAQAVEEAQPAMVNGAWTQQWQVVALPDAQVSFNRSAAVKALQAAIVNKTQERLDAFGLTREYDNTNSIAKYATLSDAQIAAMPSELQPTVTKFRAECAYLQAAVAQTWAVLYALLAQVQAGNWPTVGAGQTPASFSDIEPSLPALAWPA